MDNELNKSIIKIRVALQNASLKKSGKNQYAGFDYFELKDFLPKLNELMLEEGINDIFSIEDNEVTLTLIKGQYSNRYCMPFVMFDTPVNIKKDKATGEVREVKSMQDIQYLGALNTYYKRYIYLNAFGITDGEVIDSMNNEDIKTTPKKTTLITDKQKEMIKSIYENDEIKLELVALGKSKLSDLTIKEASDLIKKKQDNVGDFREVLN